MADHLQLHRPASIEKIAVPDKKAVFHVHAGGVSPGDTQQHGASSHEAPAVSFTPRTSTKQQHLPASPRACLCSPTMHAGSFRCRLHRGIGGGGGSVGSGLHEMSKKPGV
ncbi:hypothetical protein BS78_10G187500 [Paspalum vaginatum]|nr:hypothetical protein BS78_10G187500 [Paspalum vaginatum]